MNNFNDGDQTKKKNSLNCRWLVKKIYIAKTAKFYIKKKSILEMQELVIIESSINTCTLLGLLNRFENYLIFIYIMIAKNKQILNNSNEYFLQHVVL